MADRMHIEVLWRIKLDFGFFVVPPQHDATDRILRHDIHSKERTIGTMNLETCGGMFNCESVMELCQYAALKIHHSHYRIFHSAIRKALSRGARNYVFNL